MKEGASRARTRPRPMRRWSLRTVLTLRFAAVTVATLLLVFLVLFGLLFREVLVANWRLSPETWIDVALRTAAPTTRRILEEEPDNTSLIQMWLGFVANPTSIFRIGRVGRVELTMRTTGSASAFLFDGAGNLLGASDMLRHGESVGSVFNPADYPAVGSAVEAAFGGAVEAGDLVLPDARNSDAFAIAVPISGRSPDDLVGVLAVAFGPLANGRLAAGLTLRVVLVLLLAIMVLSGAVAMVFAFLTARSLAMRISRISELADRWSKGDFADLISDAGGDEIGVLSSHLDSMARQMDGLLGEREQTAVVQERVRMARDLHDSVKQQALAASFQIGAALSFIETDTTRAQVHLREADDLVDNVRTELASLIDGAYEADASSSSVSAAIGELAHAWSGRTGIDVTVEAGKISQPGVEVRTCLRRIVQEALSNVVRHSGATCARVTLGCEGDNLVLVVADNGSGFDPGGANGGVGLTSMRERCDELGGRFEITSGKDQGTQLRVTIPREETDGRI